MKSEECLFCSIISGKAPSEVVLDMDGFLVIKNKFPKAPVHLLVVDKKHREKSDTIAGVYSAGKYWDMILDAARKALEKVDLLKSGEYEVILNGSGYAHFQHEHVHILGGYESGQGSRT